MRKYISFVIIVATSIILSACNNGIKKQKYENDYKAYETSDSAVLYYTDYHFNLDTVIVGQAKSCVFNYSNKGKAPLLISNVFTSCGCISIDWNKQPLMPDQSDSIQLNITLQGAGYFQKAIVIKNNSANEPVLTLRLEGVAIEKNNK